MTILSRALAARPRGIQDRVWDVCCCCCCAREREREDVARARVRGSGCASEYKHSSRVRHAHARDVSHRCRRCQSIPRLSFISTLATIVTRESERARAINMPMSIFFFLLAFLYRSFLVLSWGWEESSRQRAFWFFTFVLFFSRRERARAAN